MKFKVSSKVKGSLILKSLGRAVRAGATVHIEGDVLYADDVQRAIKSEFLENENPEEQIKIQQEIIDKTKEVVLINKTDRVVIVGNIPIRPNGSIIRDVTKLDMNAVQSAMDKDLIQVIVDVGEELFEETGSQQEYSKTPPAKTELETGIDILEDSPSSGAEELAAIIAEADAEEAGVEEEVRAGVWDAKQQKMVKPQVVPKTGQKLLYDEEEEEDVDMVDALDEVNEVDEDEEIRLINEKIERMKKTLAKKKSAKKKSAKKKSTKKKTAKKKDSKVIKTKFSKESEEDIVQAMDSMGNPLKNDMTHMVDDVTTGEISFCDQEHAQKSIDEAKKRDSGINIDLD